VSDAEYAEYEATCKRIRAENALLLEEFAGWLKARGLAKSTVAGHCERIEFYVNDFLLYEDAVTAAEGFDRAGMFLGFWFIRKALWANRAHIRSNAASLKKFYAFMAETGRVSQEDLDGLKEKVKEEMPDWLATMDR